MAFSSRKLVGFTLIELLIVVAIIAILAAIAVPNFLEAQTRAKSARAKNDLRVLATGLEAYCVDTNKYPWSNNSSRAFMYGDIRPGFKPTLERLTTPVAYLTGKGNFVDPFVAKGAYQGAALETVVSIDQYADRENYITYWYIARALNQVVWDQQGEQDPKWWIVESCGPDRMHHNAGTFFNNVMPTYTPAGLAAAMKMIYDATNGTVSRGSIWRVGGTKMGTGQPFYDAALTQK
jgi:prepilin-type N-terminal cleavage/methylation domain-containing protein